MIKLIDIIKESQSSIISNLSKFPKDNILIKKIKKDNPRIRSPYIYLDKFVNRIAPVSPSYDFGGGIEDSLKGNDVVVVDWDDPSDYDEEDINPDKYIQADLNKPIKLPPRKGVFFCDSLLQITNKNVVYNSADQALVSGGIIGIKDFPSEIYDFISYFPSYKLLEILLDWESWIETYNDFENNGNIYAIFQK
jgi:hypothetical protein